MKNPQEVTITIEDPCGCQFVDDYRDIRSSHTPCNDHSRVQPEFLLLISMLTQRTRETFVRIALGRNHEDDSVPSAMRMFLVATETVVMLHETIGDPDQGGNDLQRAAHMHNAMNEVRESFRILYPKAESDARTNESGSEGHGDKSPESSYVDDVRDLEIGEDSGRESGRPKTSPG